MSCTDLVCGTGGWAGPLPGDPDNNSILRATPAFGGIDVSWTMPATNPFAVAHTVIRRGISNNFNAAVFLASVGGDFFYDKSDTAQPVEYFYWIQFVSVNGTYGDWIGPASAVAKPLIEQVIEDLTGKIDAGVLAQSLKKEIDKITLNYGELLTEIGNRVAGNAALSAALADLQNGVTQALAFVNTEITTRIEGDSALAQQVTLLAAANANNAAAIIEDRIARVDADGALAQQIDLVSSANGDNSAAIQTVESSKIGYAALAGTSSPFDGNGVTVVYSATKYPSALFPEYAANRKRIIDKTGATEWNATPAGAAKPVVWLVGLPLATAVKTVQVTGPEGQIASVEQGFIAQKDLNGNFKAQYTAKVDVNGLVGGFGIYNDGKVVEAGFDVDRFWVGRTSANKRKPFIIENGTVYIDDAAINKLTFSKLRDEAGTFVVQNGKVKANYIDTNGLVIRDTYGNPIFGAGTALSTAYISGLGALATKNAVAIGTHVTFPDGSLMNTSDFVSRLSKINDTNISTFMSSAAIGNAYIGTAAIKSANIGDLQVDTIKIAGNAVSIMFTDTGNRSATIVVNVPAGEVWEAQLLGSWQGLASAPYAATNDAPRYEITGGVSWPLFSIVTAYGNDGVAEFPIPSLTRSSRVTLYPGANTLSCSLYFSGGTPYVETTLIAFVRKR